MVNQLGAFPLPVEIMPFGHGSLLKTLKSHQYAPELRKDEQGVFTTDGGHYLADLHLGEIEDAFILDTELKKFPGVLEHGLFLNTVNKVVVAGSKKVEVISFR